MQQGASGESRFHSIPQRLQTVEGIIELLVTFSQEPIVTFSGVGIPFRITRSWNEEKKAPSVFLPNLFHCFYGEGEELQRWFWEVMKISARRRGGILLFFIETRDVPFYEALFFRVQASIA